MKRQASIGKKNVVSEVVPGVGFIAMGGAVLAGLPMDGIAVLALVLVLCVFVVWGFIMELPGKTEPGDEYTREMEGRAGDTAALAIAIVALVAYIIGWATHVDVPLEGIAALFAGFALLLRGSLFAWFMRGDGDGCED